MSAEIGRIWICAFCILLISLDQFASSNPAADLSPKDQSRPAKVACDRYKKIITELDQSSKPVFSTKYIDNKIRVKPGEFPFVVAVGYSLKDDGESGEINYLCAGILISEKHVLTAAHCVVNVARRIPSEVLLGAIDQGETVQGEGAQRISISRLIPHPQFDVKFNYNDIAILELKDTIKFTNYVQPTCLMTEPLTPFVDNNSATVLAWKNIEEDENSSMKLVKIEKQRLVEREECSKSYDPNSSLKFRQIPNGLIDGMICIAKSEDSKNDGDACSATSGSPVIVPSINHSDFLTVGFPLFGYRCGENKPTVGLSIYKYLNWIEDQVWPARN